MTYTEQCEKEYINWFNNYLSIAKFAEDMNYTESYAIEVLRIGKEYHLDKALNDSMPKNTIAKAKTEKQIKEAYEIIYGHKGEVSNELGRIIIRNSYG